MMRRAKTGFLFLLTMALLLVSAGCPDSTPIGSGNGSVLLSVYNTNVGKWGGGAFFQVDRIAVRPTDPEANALLGARSLLLLQEGVVVDGTTPQVDPSFFNALFLSGGEYQIVEFTLSNFFFGEANPMDDPECEFIFAYDTTMTNFPTPLTFTVQPNSDGEVRMTFDVAALADAVVASYDDPSTAIFFPDCDGDLDPDLLAAQLGTFLTLD
jgi:hypothetical protein